MPKDRIQQMEELSERPDYQGYDKHIPGFREALDNNDIEGCFDCLSDFLSKQTTELDVKERLLNRLYDIELKSRISKLGE